MSSCTGCGLVAQTAGASRNAAGPSCTGWVELHRRGLVAEAVGLVAQAVEPSCRGCEA